MKNLGLRMAFICGVVIHHLYVGSWCSLIVF